MGDRLAVWIGDTALKNPVIAAPGEHLIPDSGLRAAIAAGAGAVVMKSTNESAAAKRQLLQAEYAALGPEWQRLLWGEDTPASATVLTRSGLHPLAFEAWLDQGLRLLPEARAADCLLVPSLILAGLPQAVAQARAVAEAGFPVLELNIGTPYASLAQKGAVSTELDPARVAEIVRAVTGAVTIPVWVKLSGQSERVPALAQAAVTAGAATVVIAGRALGMLPDLDTLAPVLGTSCGIGGGWNLPMTCHWLAETRAALGRDQPLIGINGATSGPDVARMILAGASAVGMTSAVMMRGFGVLAEAVDTLESWCAEKSLTAAQAIGRAADARRSFAEMPVLDEVWRNFIPPAARAG